MAVVVRDGKIRLNLPSNYTEKEDGTIWVNDMPLLGITDQAEKDRVAVLMKAGKYDEIPAEYFCRFGSNANGLWIGDYDEWFNDPGQRAKRIEKEREEAKESSIYLSSRGWGDFSGVEWIGDITRPTAEILAECRDLLETGYDVDNKDQSDNELIAKIELAKNEYAKKIKNMEEKEAKRAERERRREQCSMSTTLEIVEDEGGKTKIAHHTITLDNGKSFAFADRNIFDVGRVINPEYEIAPGFKGGIRVGDDWQTFKDDKGWVVVRPLTADEKRGLDYVVEFGYHAGRGIRM